MLRCACWQKSLQLEKPTVIYTEIPVLWGEWCGCDSGWGNKYRDCSLSAISHLLSQDLTLGSTLPSPSSSFTTHKLYTHIGMVGTLFCILKYHSLISLQNTKVPKFCDFFRTLLCVFTRAESKSWPYAMRYTSAFLKCLASSLLLLYIFLFVAALHSWLDHLLSIQQ